MIHTLTSVDVAEVPKFTVESKTYETRSDTGTISTLDSGTGAQNNKPTSCATDDGRDSSITTNDNTTDKTTTE